MRPKIDAVIVPELFDHGFTNKGKNDSGIGLFISRHLAHRSAAELQLKLDSAQIEFVLSWQLPLEPCKQQLGPLVKITPKDGSNRLEVLFMAIAVA